MDEGNNPDADGDFSNAPIFNFNDGGRYPKFKTPCPYDIIGI